MESSFPDIRLSVRWKLFGALFLAASPGIGGFESIARCSVAGFLATLAAGWDADGRQTFLLQSIKTPDVAHG